MWSQCTWRGLGLCLLVWLLPLGSSAVRVSQQQLTTGHSRRPAFANLIRQIGDGPYTWTPGACQNYGAMDNADTPSVCTCQAFSAGRYCEHVTCADAGIKRMYLGGCACAPGFHGKNCEQSR